MAIANEPSTLFCIIQIMTLSRPVFERLQKIYFENVSLHFRSYTLEFRFRMHQSYKLGETMDYAAASVTPNEFANDPPHNQEASTRRTHAVHRRQVIYLTIFCLSLSAAAATFTIIVWESSQVRSASTTSGCFRVALLVAVITDVCVTAMVIFRIFRGGPTDSQLAPQARWDTYRGAIIDVIEGCMVFPVFLLNAINACSQYYASQNALDYVTQVATIVLFLVWITVWLSGGQRAEGESADQDQRSTVVHSGGDRHHVGPGEANHREFLEEPPDIFDSFTCSDVVGMVISALTIN